MSDELILAEVSRGLGLLILEDDRSEGTGALVSDEKKTVRSPAKPGGARKANSGKGRDGTVGTALRTVYDDTVKENIPAEMLDLLGKLN